MSHALTSSLLPYDEGRKTPISTRSPFRGWLDSLWRLGRTDAAAKRPTKTRLMLLDVDERTDPGLRARTADQHKDLLTFCAAHDLVLDCATSDHTMYLVDRFGGHIALI